MLPTLQYMTPMQNVRTREVACRCNQEMRALVRPDHEKEDWSENVLSVMRHVDAGVSSGPVFVSPRHAPDHLMLPNLRMARSHWA